MSRPFIETRTTLLREKPAHQMEPPTPEQRLDWVRRTLKMNRLPPLRAWSVAKRSLPARVNQGRWIADCPDCTGAEMADPAWPYSVCCSCGAGPYRVEFPPEREAIEQALLRRPHAAFMSWEPGITVEELLAGGPFHRSWTAPRTYVTGEIITASILNTDHRDDMLETAPAKAAANLELFEATGANALQALPYPRRVIVASIIFG